MRYSAAGSSVLFSGIDSPVVPRFQRYCSCAAAALPGVKKEVSRERLPYPFSNCLLKPYFVLSNTYGSYGHPIDMKLRIGYWLSAVVANLPMVRVVVGPAIRRVGRCNNFIDISVIFNFLIRHQYIISYKTIGIVFS